MSVEKALKSLLNKFASQRKSKRGNPAPSAIENLESRALLTLIGTNAIVSNTIQSTVETGGTEMPFGPTGSAVVVDNATDPEFESFVGLYDIDIDGNTISMIFNQTDDTLSERTGVIEDGTFDRYYFEFDLAENESIAAVSASAGATLQPNVSFNGNVVVVEIAPGMEAGDGFDALINVNILRSGTVITGRKFHDANQDGIRDINEAYLNGWTVELRDITQDTVVATTTTRNIDRNGDGSIDPETESGIYLFSDAEAGTYVVQEVIPEGWTQTLPNNPNVMAAFALDSSLELSSTGNEFLNWGGLNEKWFFGRAAADSTDTSWYYVTPDGSVYRWNGSPRTALTGTLVETLDASYYDDASLIYNAPSPRQYIADVDVSNPQTFRGFDFGNFLAAPQFEVTVEQETNLATINWEAEPEATYDVWISDIAANQQIQLVPDLNGENIPLITELPDRRYRVWVRTNSRGASSSWSPSQQFEFFRDAVNLITSTRETTVDATPTIEWRPLAGAESYDIRVTNGEQTVYLQNDIAQLSHRIANPLQFGVDYHVAVRANFSDGSQTAWDEGLPIRIDGRTTPVVDGSAVSWAAVPGATEYEIWVNRFDNDGNLLQSQIVSQNIIDETSSTLPVLERGDYAIWIRAIRSEGAERYTSFWSGRVDFFVTATEEAPEEEATLIELASLSTDAEREATLTVAEASQETTNAEPVAEAETDQITTVMAEIASSDLLYEDQIQAPTLDLPSSSPFRGPAKS